MKEREKLLAETFDWRGITVSVTYEPNWFNWPAPGSDDTRLS